MGGMTLKERSPETYEILVKLGGVFEEVREVGISDVIIREEDYPRSSPDKERVEEFVQRLEEGGSFPPIVITKEGYLVDGFHRFQAYLKGKVKSFEAEIWDIEKDFIVIASQAINSSSNRSDLPLSGSDKRRAIVRDYSILRERFPERERDDIVGIIASVLRTSTSYVLRILSEEGVLKKEKEEEKRQFTEKVLELYESGHGLSSIAQKLNVNRSKVYYVLKVEDEKLRNVILEVATEVISAETDGLTLSEARERREEICGKAVKEVIERVQEKVKDDESIQSLEKRKIPFEAENVVREIYDYFLQRMGERSRRKEVKEDYSLFRVSGREVSEGVKAEDVESVRFEEDLESDFEEFEDVEEDVSGKEEVFAEEVDYRVSDEFIEKKKEEIKGILLVIRKKYGYAVMQKVLEDVFYWAMDQVRADESEVEVV